MHTAVMHHRCRRLRCGLTLRRSADVVNHRWAGGRADVRPISCHRTTTPEPSQQACNASCSKQPASGQADSLCLPHSKHATCKGRHAAKTMQQAADLTMCWCLEGSTQQAALLWTITQKAAHLRIDRQIAVHILQVPLRVKFEVVGDSNPQEPLDALPVGLLDAGGNLSALTNACRAWQCQGRHGSNAAHRGAASHFMWWGSDHAGSTRVGQSCKQCTGRLSCPPCQQAYLRHHPERSLLCCLQTGSTGPWQRSLER